MFKKSQRVSSWLFKPIMRGTTQFSSYFRIKSKIDVDDFRVSVVVPKKIIKKRVARNTAKRKVLHYVKSLISQDQPRHIVIWLTADIQKSQNWQQEITQLINKLPVKK